jgi:hypothetical protein
MIKERKKKKKKRRRRGKNGEDHKMRQTCAMLIVCLPAAAYILFLVYTHAQIGVVNCLLFLLLNFVI